jgi:multiple sugar transport system permease protein
MKTSSISLVTALRVVAVAVLLAITLFPLYWILSTAFKPNEEVLAYPPKWIPSSLSFSNFSFLLDPDGQRFMLNSAIVTFGSTVLSLLLGTPAAYALSRHKFPYNAGKFVGLWVLITRFMPPFVFIIPMFLMFRSVGMLDTPLAVLLVYAGGNLPLVIWVMTPAVAQIPGEINEAAMVDGAGTFRTFISIVLPLLRPAIATAGSLAAIFAWNEFFFALILTQDQARTMPVFIATFISDRGLDWGAIAASSFVLAFPIVVLALFFQKQFIAGLTRGAIK